MKYLIILLLTTGCAHSGWERDWGEEPQPERPFHTITAFPSETVALALPEAFGTTARLGFTAPLVGALR